MRTGPHDYGPRAGVVQRFFAPGEVLGRRRGGGRCVTCRSRTAIELAIHRPVYHLRYGRPTTVHSKRPTLKSGSSCSGPTDDVACSQCSSSRSDSGITP